MVYKQSNQDWRVKDLKGEGGGGGGKRAQIKKKKKNKAQK